MFLLAIEWSVSPEILQLGPISLRWYGLLFALGFLIGLFMVRKMFLAEGAPEEWLDKCFMYMVVGTVLGARLGHVFFYDWDYYSQHLSEIPQIWKGGLASHGGAMGIVIALWIFSRQIGKWVFCFRLPYQKNSNPISKRQDSLKKWVFCLRLPHK